MSGSVAEERIRGKAEALLRRLFPEARIIHELVLKQGGVRIDLAAVSPCHIALLEIKSERDVLKRLPEQVKAMQQVGDLLGVCIAEKHRPMVRRSYEAKIEGAHVVPWGVHVLVETDDGFDTGIYDPFHPQAVGGALRDRAQVRLCNPADRLEMLWADELKWISGSKAPRQPAKYQVCESMTGRQIRAAVCTALRARPFPRADPAVPWPVQSIAA